MPRFFVAQEQMDQNKIILTGDDAHHIARSLRMAVGERITVCDDRAVEYECVITHFDSDKEVTAEIVKSRHCNAEPPMRITLFQALSKGDKLDTVIQKAVECGVCEIVPFESERCIVRAKEDAEARKTERRCKIASEAAKQCGRGILPKVTPTVSFDRALELAGSSPLVLFCYEGDNTAPIGKVLSERLLPNDEGKYPDVAVMVGSEGGFSPSEAARAAECGCVLTGLGKRILRTETAPVFAVSCIVCRAELC